MSAFSPKFYLFKRSNGKYYIGFLCEDGRRRWKSSGVSTKPQALKALAEFKRFVGRIKTKPLSDFAEEFFRYAGGNFSSSSLAMYRGMLKNFIAMFGNPLLTEITPRTIDTFKAERLRFVKAVSVNIELRTLRAFLNVAVRWKLIEKNPFTDVSLAVVTEQSPVFITREDFQKLVGGIREYWLKDIVMFAVLTGMRRGEILNLRWQDVDLNKRVIQIESSPTFRTKQGKRRTIPLNDTAFTMLLAKQSKDPSAYVFTLSDRRILESWVTHLFKRYVRKSGLSERIHFHSLRHTFATWLVQGGVPIYEVQKLLGHSSVKMTEIYSHLVASELHSAVNKIDLQLN